MFTGIVQGKATVSEILQREDVVTMKFAFPPCGLDGVAIGASIALAGCCLTVTSAEGDVAAFDVVPETLARTSLGALIEGDQINFERSLRFGEEVGGHILSGHVDTVATISHVEILGNSRVVMGRQIDRWVGKSIAFL